MELITLIVTTPVAGADLGDSGTVSSAAEDACAELVALVDKQFGQIWR